MAEPRQTRQRNILRDILINSKRPMSPHELLEAAQNELPSLSLSTVYRTLKLFSESGLLAEVHLPGETVRYEHADREHHHHFHCRQCDRAFDLTSCPGDAISDMAPPGFVVSGHEITLYGTCDQCAGTQR